MDKIFDSIIIGGGQSGLACGYYLRRSKLKYLILDKQEHCGGAWRNGWDSPKIRGGIADLPSLFLLTYISFFWHVPTRISQQ